MKQALKARFGRKPLYPTYGNLLREHGRLGTKNYKEKHADIAQSAQNEKICMIYQLQSEM
jgi:hypothetical protein